MTFVNVFVEIRRFRRQDRYSITVFLVIVVEQDSEKSQSKRYSHSASSKIRVDKTMQILISVSSSLHWNVAKTAFDCMAPKCL